MMVRYAADRDRFVLVVDLLVDLHRQPVAAIAPALARPLREPLSGTDTTLRI